MADPKLSSPFAPFRRPQAVARTTRAYQKLFFYIQFDTYGAYLSVCDKGGKEVDTSHHHYSGPERQLLQALRRRLHWLVLRQEAK